VQPEYLQLLRQGLFVRFALVCLLPFVLAACSPPGPKIGEVSVLTGSDGKMKSVFMSQSTGNPKADARFMLFARTTFPSRMPDGKPNTRYRYPIAGDPKNSSGDVRVWYGGKLD
jgi:hypothetical protein